MIWLLELLYGIAEGIAKTVAMFFITIIVIIKSVIEFFYPIVVRSLKIVFTIVLVVIFLLWIKVYLL